jgi:hypothetical protein
VVQALNHQAEEDSSNCGIFVILYILLLVVTPTIDLIKVNIAPRNLKLLRFSILNDISDYMLSNSTAISAIETVLQSMQQQESKKELESEKPVQQTSEEQPKRHSTRTKKPRQNYNPCKNFLISSY